MYPFALKFTSRYRYSDLKIIDIPVIFKAPILITYSLDQYFLIIISKIMKI